uniref:heavy metal translocating P-type ATPase n=1 Tax=Pararhizobium sp. IMCC3301 TaxID=3067904 RepID=UPI00274043C0|nr:heavy metal translocating P-type ATPase [Pararhizobium sp. IMCC3301]
MGCCGSEALAESEPVADGQGESAMLQAALIEAGQRQPDGTFKFIFSVPAMHCGGCISAVERAVLSVPGVKSARANLTLKRLTVLVEQAADIIAAESTLDRSGFSASPIDQVEVSEQEDERTSSALLRALAVAGFAAGNIMLLSVSVWSGADGPTRDLFHLISAVIAIPVVGYSGQVFFRSALTALRGGRLNMDVPISLAVLLALGMSLYETFTGGTDAYFDAAVTLLFFLLIGRYLDQRMRDKARKSVVSLSRMSAKGGSRIMPDGGLVYTPVEDIMPQMRLRIFPGDRIPVDGTILRGGSDLDRSLVTGESALVPVSTGDGVEAGTLNVTGSIDLVVTKQADQSFLSEVMKMLEAAENGRGAFVRIADRMARIYAPAVHLLALAAFIGWMVASGGDWHRSLTVAIAVLIVTCPCALGLAVPVVHVVGATRLFQNGILMRDGSALERLAEIDRVVFDKTGTLTMGDASIAAVSGLSTADRARAKTLAAASSHPASKAIAGLLSAELMLECQSVAEIPGFGVEARIEGELMRLGRPGWVAEIAAPKDAPAGDAPGSQTPDGSIAFAVAGAPAAGFALVETVRTDAEQTISALKRQGVPSEILSGDGPGPVARIGQLLGIDALRSGETPQSKFTHITTLQQDGHKVLMVGDGINDAPSLAAGHASMAPASASDIGRQAADFVFTRDSLKAVPFAIGIARRGSRLVRQNFGLAILYNCIAVPLAVAGFVTPLVAAIAMSASSIVVVANSLRLLREKDTGAMFSGAVGSLSRTRLKRARA